MQFIFLPKNSSKLTAFFFNFSFNPALNLYLPLFLTKSPHSTPSFNAFKKVVFIHFLSAERLACMLFLMAMEEEPERSARVAMVVIRLAL